VKPPLLGGGGHGMPHPVGGFIPELKGKDEG